MRLPAQLLQRKVNAHKGDFGHVLILAGSYGLTGAAILTGDSALRSGAGLVTLGIPRSLHNVFARRVKELMLKPLPETKNKTLSIKAYPVIMKLLKERMDVLVIGPGLSQNKSTQELIRKVVKNCPKPMVIDADGLNALSYNPDILLNTQYAMRDTIITPHPGEMSRLTGLSTAEINKNRKSVAKKFASDYNITVVLKGHNTVIADKNNIYLNKTGNPGMATAGAGDVLSGIIGAFLAQGLDAFSSAKYAVYLHGLAGDLAAKEKTQLGMIASDIIGKIPAAIKISS